MPSKNYTLFFILSVGFVLLSIAFITILGQTSKPDTGSADIRAKATVQNALKLVGVIEGVSGNTLKIGQVKFESKKDEVTNMGSWTVTAPSSFQPGSLSTGMKVFLSVDASTFNTETKTMTALAISKM